MHKVPERKVALLARALRLTKPVAYNVASQGTGFNLGSSKLQAAAMQFEQRG